MHKSYKSGRIGSHLFTSRWVGSSWVVSVKSDPCPTMHSGPGSHDAGQLAALLTLLQRWRSRGCSKRYASRRPRVEQTHRRWSWWLLQTRKWQQTRTLVSPAIITHLYFTINGSRYLNNDNKGERQIRETLVYKVRQTMNHVRGQTGTSLIRYMSNRQYCQTERISVKISISFYQLHQKLHNNQTSSCTPRLCPYNWRQKFSWNS